MKERVIENCSITLRDSKILVPWITDINSKECKENDNKLHGGVNVEADEVFVPCNGVVIQVVPSETFNSITVQYDAYQCLRFDNIVDPDVDPGQIVEQNTRLGTCDGYVHFEYLTTEEADTWTHTVGPLKLFKHDPTFLLSSRIGEPETTSQLNKLYDETYEMLSNNKGEE